MAYNPYPQAPTNPNGWQVLGQALQQGGQQVEDYSDKQAKLKQLFEEMQQKKAAAILTARAEDDKHNAAITEAALKAKDEANQNSVEEFIRGGTMISPTLAAHPDLSSRTPAPAAPSVPGGPSAADLADLSNVQGLNLPSQNVKAGGDATAMMGAALDAQPPAEMANGRTPPTRQEIIQKMGAEGVLKGKDYIEATDPWKSMDPATRAMMIAQGRGQANESPNRQTVMDALNAYAAMKAHMGKPPVRSEALAVVDHADPSGMAAIDPVIKSHLGMLLPMDPAMNPMADRVQVMRENLAFQKEKWAQAHNFDEATGKVLKPMTSATANQFGAMTAAGNSLVRLKETLDKIPDAERGPLISSILGFTKASKYSPDQQLVKNLIIETGEHLSKSFGGSGHTAEGEIANLRGLFPNQSMPPDVADKIYGALTGKIVDLWHSTKYNQRKAQTFVPPEYDQPHNIYDIAAFGLPDGQTVGGEADAGTGGEAPSYTPSAAPLPGSPSGVARSGAPKPAAPAAPAIGIPAKGNRKALDKQTAGDYLKRAGGDRQKAKQMLAKDGYNING